MQVYRDHGDIGRQGQDSFSNRWETLNIITSTAPCNMYPQPALHVAYKLILYYQIHCMQRGNTPFAHLFYSNFKEKMLNETLTGT